MAIVGNCLFSLGCRAWTLLRSVLRGLFPWLDDSGWKINLFPFDVAFSCRLSRTSLISWQALFVLACFGYTPAWAAIDDCSQPNVDCRSSILGPYKYGAGYGSGWNDEVGFGTAQAAVDAWRGFYEDLFGGQFCSFTGTVLGTFIDVSAPGSGSTGDGERNWRWGFGVESSQSILAGSGLYATGGAQCIQVRDGTQVLARRRKNVCPADYYPNSQTEPLNDYCYRSLGR
jgi:hypothetical protein